MNAKEPGGTLAEWEAEERAVRARMARPGISARAEVVGLSGNAFFAALFAGELPSIHIGETLDIWPIRIADGVAVFQGRPALAHYNPLGTVHGGWIATILDSCVGCAVHSTLSPGKAFTTVELKVNYVRGLTTNVPLLRAEGRVIHAGSRMATADGRLVDAEGKLYAHTSTTCFILDAK